MLSLRAQLYLLTAISGIPLLGARAVREGLREAYPQTVLEIGEMPIVRGDAAMLKQVWVNLIGNAFKFSASKPQPRIEVGCTEEGDEVVFHVKDNGAGFDLRYAERLFGVFQRMHAAGEFPGTGVGLAIVKRRGATFFFLLPAVAVASAMPATELEASVSAPRAARC